MKEFVIVTDATCDLPKEYTDKEGIKVVDMSYTIDAKTYDSTEKMVCLLMIFMKK